MTNNIALNWIYDNKIKWNEKPQHSLINEELLC